MKKNRIQFSRLSAQGPTLAWLFFLCSLCPLGLGAQTQEPPPAEPAGPALSPADTERPAASAPVADSTIYRIRRIDFNITGRSRPFALLYNGKLTDLKDISGRENLEIFIQDRTQRLINQRVLENDVHIEYTLGEMDESGKVPVDLLITVRDTWNLMIFPKPLWDNNSGFDLTIKARDYNFFGTMNPLRIDLGYLYETKNDRNDSKFNLLVDTDIPFRAMGLMWNINFDNEFNYTWGDPLNYKNSAGVAVQVPFKTTTFTFDVEHYINVNERNGDWDSNPPNGYGKDYRGKYFDGILNSVEFSAAWKIPTGIKPIGNGELTYTPRIAEEIVYTPENGHEWLDLRKGPFTKLEQKFGFERVDWIGNFRKGMDVSFNNDNSFNHNRNVWNNSYSLNATGHFILSDFFGITARTQFRHWFYHFPNDLYHEAGDVLRGILNNKLQGDLMLSLNLEFPVKIWTARPSDWFHNSKFRFFNFELYLSPMMDIGMLRNPKTPNSQDLIKMYYTAGLEMFIFPEFMRSLYLRFSYGVNLEDWVRYHDIPLKNNEFFIGLGHFFGE
ncbi:hypothetical protein AGMMS50268_01340 [Spirochaetia bacterium]|nr:hypothetical protein AGMMS50268_01340 [Spirochaetia bacterium]